MSLILVEPLFVFGFEVLDFELYNARQSSALTQVPMFGSSPGARNLFPHQRRKAWQGVTCLTVSLSRTLLWPEAQ